jgi:hypothetical protein
MKKPNQQVLELVDLVKNYEEQMRDLQLQLESQLQNEIRIAQDYQTQLQKEREHRLTLES